MAVNEDVKRETVPTQDVGQSPESSDGGEPEGPEPESEGRDLSGSGEGGEAGRAPTQLGTARFVYAAYFASAIAVAFLVSKILGFAWLKLQAYKPAIGEPRDDILMPASALVGAIVAVYYWFRTRARQLAEEVASEMSKVTWPSRTEVTNGTVVVIVTTVVSTVFFALMDKFWGFVTNLVYGGT
jgi:preprotein translocase subunit SecE